MAAGPDSIREKAKQRLDEIQRQKQRLEDRKRKLEREMEELRVREAELQELLGMNPTPNRAVGRGATRKTRARLDALHRILFEASEPMAPKELMEALTAQLGPDQAGSRVALQDLLRRSPELFENVDRGRWTVRKEESDDGADSIDIPF